MEFPWLKPQHFHFTEPILACWCLKGLHFQPSHGIISWRVWVVFGVGVLTMCYALWIPRKKTKKLNVPTKKIANVHRNTNKNHPPSFSGSFGSNKGTFPSKFSSLKCRKHQHNGRNLSLLVMVGGCGGKTNSTLFSNMKQNMQSNNSFESFKKETWGGVAFNCSVCWLKASFWSKHVRTSNMGVHLPTMFKVTKRNITFWNHHL